MNFFLKRTLFGEKNVGRLEVSVEDVFRMTISYCGGHLSENVNDIPLLHQTGKRRKLKNQFTPYGHSKTFLRVKFNPFKRPVFSGFQRTFFVWPENLPNSLRRRIPSLSWELRPSRRSRDMPRCSGGPSTPWFWPHSEPFAYPRQWVRACWFLWWYTAGRRFCVDRG